MAEIHDDIGSVSGSHLLMYVLDVLQYDIEPLDSVLRLLNSRSNVGWREFWPRDFEKDEVVQALETLAREGLVRVLQVNPSIDELEPVEGRDHLWQRVDALWFVPTRRGRSLWQEWEPPASPDGNSLDR